MARKNHPFKIVNVHPESWELNPKFEAYAYSAKFGEVRAGTKRNVLKVAQTMFDGCMSDVVVYVQKIPGYTKSLPMMAL